MERSARLELASQVWKTRAQPIYHVRSKLGCAGGIRTHGVLSVLAYETSDIGHLVDRATENFIGVLFGLSPPFQPARMRSCPRLFELGSGRWNRTSYLSPIKQVPILMCLTRTENWWTKSALPRPPLRCKLSALLNELYARKLGTATGTRTLSDRLKVCLPTHSR